MLTALSARAGLRQNPNQSWPPLDPGPERWTPSALRIDPWTVLRLTRYRLREDVAPPIWEAASAMTSWAVSLAEPQARFRLTRVVPEGPAAVRLAGGPTFTGRAVHGLLAGCPVAVVFVLSLGPRLEAEVTSLAERRDLLEAFLLDTAGWALIEAAVRALRLDLRAGARAHGSHLTHRLGPGHLDWPLTEQRALVGLLGDLGGWVRVSAEGLLVPFKSVTGVFGLTPTRD
jgi:hypothetical protein